MSEGTTSRRGVLKRLGAAATGAVCVAGTAAADVSTDQSGKEHRLTLSVDPGSGTVPYDVTVPDANPKFDNLEKLLDDNVTYNTNNDTTNVDGNLKGGDSPYYDEILFDGDPEANRADLNVADARVRVELDGDVYDGQTG